MPVTVVVTLKWELAPPQCKCLWSSQAVPRLSHEWMGGEGGGGSHGSPWGPSSLESGRPAGVAAAWGLRRERRLNSVFQVFMVSFADCLPFPLLRTGLASGLGKELACGLAGGGGARAGKVVLFL